ncbi:hypothetical protein B0H10DRAFT_47283 [Mycena sp. CBHHK59/15]|nr:hypothetical protein B0H10DRAFT_47283 [Mycena sp. CBHHK59/15]
MGRRHLGARRGGRDEAATVVPKCTPQREALTLTPPRYSRGGGRPRKRRGRRSGNSPRLCATLRISSFILPQLSRSHPHLVALPPPVTASPAANWNDCQSSRPSVQVARMRHSVHSVLPYFFFLASSTVSAYDHIHVEILAAPSLRSPWPYAVCIFSRTRTTSTQCAYRMGNESYVVSFWLIVARCLAGCPLVHLTHSHRICEGARHRCAVRTRSRVRMQHTCGRACIKSSARVECGEIERGCELHPPSGRPSDLECSA